jgi:hypothetical protein
MKKLLFVALLALSASACSSTERYVTLTHWQTEQVVYVAYAETEMSMFARKDSAKVRKCIIKQDNTVECVDQQELNKLLAPEK